MKNQITRISVLLALAITLSACGTPSMNSGESKESMNDNFGVITVVAPDVSGEKNMADFKKWYEDLGYKNVTVFFDEDGKYMKEFGVRAFPSSAHIGEDSALLNFAVGHSSNGKVKAVFEKTLDM